MYKVTLELDSSLFAFDFTEKSNLKPIFVKAFENKKEAKQFFKTYVKENNCTMPFKNSNIAHHEGKEISCNF